MVLPHSRSDTHNTTEGADASSIGADADTYRFPFLTDTIKALVVEGESAIVDLVSEALRVAPWYERTITGTSRQAEDLLRGEQRFALCIVDLGLSSPGTEEFRLIRHFSTRTAFIAVSGYDSLERGFAARQMGARAAVCTQNLASGFLIERVNKVFLHGILNPPCARGDSVITKAASTVERHSPGSVALWAEKLCVSETYLRRRYAEKCGVTPKLVLFLHTLYSMALYNRMPRLSAARRIKRYETLYRNRRHDIDQYLG